MREIGRRVAAWIAAIAILFAFEAQLPALAEESGMVRVWLTKLGSNSSITIRPTCDYYLYDMPLRRIPAGERATFVADNGAIVMTMGDATLRLGNTARLNRSRSGREGIAFVSPSRGNRYCGDLILTANGAELLLVLDIYIEDYLYGVVGYEMSPGYSLEALKAQAIVARNYALKKRRDRSKYAYDLTDNASNQTFKGLNTSSSYANVLRAVDETRGQALYYGNSLANCYYGASNGGQTESTKNAWGGALAYSIVVDDPYDLAGTGKVKTAAIRRDASNLNAQLEQVLLAGVVAQAEKNGVSIVEAKIESIESIELADARFAAPSRLYQTAIFALTASVRDAAGNRATGSCAVRVPVYGGIEAWYGLSIKSENNETVRVDASERAFTISMGRNGHGVGMSQTGAQVMAKNYGMSVAEILDFYYPGCSVRAIALSDSTADADVPNAIAAARTGAKCALYDAAAETANVIAVIEAGAAIQIYAASGEWAAVACGSTAGYMRASAISECVPAGESVVQEENVYATVAASSTPLRILPIETSGELARLSRGETVHVIAYTARWAAVETGSGLRGYALLDALSRIVDSTPAPSPTPTPAPTQDAIQTLDGEWYVRVTAATWMNAQASAQSEVICALPEGTVLRIYAYNSEWAAVETADGARGFVPLNRVTFEPAPTPTPALTPTPAQDAVQTLNGKWYVRVVQESGMILRSAPRAGSDAIARLKKDEVLRIYAYTSEWAAVETQGGARGFAPMGALKLTGEPKQTAETIYAIDGEHYARVVASGGASVYAGVSTSADFIARLEKGDLVRAYAYTSEWVAIETASGVKGYVPIGALQLVEAETPAIEGGAVTTVRGTQYAYISVASANLYASCSASSRALDRLAYGTRVQIGAYNSVWACVKANGHCGFVRRNALRVRSPHSTSAQDVIQAEFYAQAIQTAYAYAAPNASAAPIGRFAQGDRVTVYAYNNAFAYVGAGEYRGFVELKYLRIVL